MSDSEISMSHAYFPAQVLTLFILDTGKWVLFNNRGHFIRVLKIEKNLQGQKYIIL